MNLRAVLRNLFKTPVVTAVAVVSLALGIGGNAAMFSVLDQMVLRAMPFTDPDRVVLLYAPGPLQGSVSTDEAGGPSFSLPTYRGMVKSQTPFTGLAAGAGFSASFSYNGNAIRDRVHLVSGNYFDVLGVRASLGRVLGPGDDVTPGGHPVIVLGHRYWTSRLGADPGVLNRTIIVNGYPMTVVGVAAAGYDGERPGRVPAAYVPLSMRDQMVPGDPVTQSRRHHWLPMFGRLKPGQSIESARTAIQAAYAAEKEEEIRALTSPDATFVTRYRAKQIVLKPGRQGRGSLRNMARTSIILLLGITAAVLLIACANVANLLLARAAARGREIALRVALGASRGQLIALLLAESQVLAAIAGLLGLAVAWVTLRLISSGIPPSAGVELETSLNPRVLLFCFLITTITGLVFGLAPALRAARPDLVTTLKDQAGQASGSGGSNRFLRALVTSQMAASAALLICAGLFGKSLLNLTSIQLGFRADHLISFTVDPRLNKYNQQQTMALYQQLEARLSALPGVSGASASAVPAIAGNSWGQNITVEGYTPAKEGADNAFFNVTGAGYQRTMGVPLIAGREFTEADDAAGAKVVMVNEAFVRQFFNRQKGDVSGVIGRHIGLGGGTVKPDRAIAGIVKDSNYSSIQEKPSPVFFLPYRQMLNLSGMYFYLRTAVPPETLIPQIRREVASLDPNLPVSELKTMQAQIDENLFAQRLMSVNIAVFAGLATLLAAIGLYGVLAYGVERRTREIGIRMALGAAPGHVRAMVIGEVAVMLALGAVVGVGLALAVTQFAQSLLEGLAGAEPPVYAAAIALLAIIALGAAAVPAIRATRIDPLVALRHE